MDLFVKRAILHSLDKETGVPVFSEVLLDLSREDIADYIEKKVMKITSSQTKTGKLHGESKIAKLISDATKENFITKTQEFMEMWVKIYTQSEEAPSSDVLFAFYEKNQESYFAFMKLGLKKSFTHFVQTGDLGLNNQLIQNKAILPQISSKPDEAFAVNIHNLEFELLEKRFEFSGEKHFYLSEYLIDQEEKPAPSIDQSVGAVKKIAKSIGKKFDTDEYETIATVKEALYDSFEEYGVIDNDFIAERVFGENLSARLAYKDEMSATLPEVTRELTDVRDISEKKFGKQKLKMNNGIELIVPIEIYRDAEAVEFINNPDGTISIMIKNIEKISNKL